MTATKKNNALSKDTQAKDLFTWNYTTPTGEEVILHAHRLENGQIPLGFLRRIRKLSEIDQTFEILERYVPKPDIELLDDLSEHDNSVYEDFLQAWLEDSGLAGEPSDGSPK